MLTPAPANAPDAKVRQQKTNGNGERIAELFKYKAAVQYNSNRCRIRLFPLEKQHLKLQGPPQQPEAQPVKMSATPNRRLSHVPTQLAGKALSPLAPSGKLSWHRFRTSFFFFFSFLSGRGRQKRRRRLYRCGVRRSEQSEFHWPQKRQGARNRSADLNRVFTSARTPPFSRGSARAEARIRLTSARANKSG